MQGLSDHEILKRLVFHARGQMASITFEKFATKLEHLLRVSTELMLGVLSYGEAVDRLLGTGHVLATAPLERAAWEVSQELEFLLRRETAMEDASRARIHALLEVSEHAAHSSEASPAFREDVNSELVALEVTHARLVEEMRTLRTRNKRLHWSGHPRSRIYAPDEPTRAVYRLLSWEAHPFAAGLHAIDIDSVGAGVKITIRPVQDAEELAARTAWAVAHTVLFAWNAYATLWHLQPVEWPWNTES